MEVVNTHSEKATMGYAARENWWTKMEHASEFNRFGIISIGFLLIGIVGGAVVGFFAREHTWQIALVVSFTMLSLTLMLAVAPMKYIIRSTVAALVVDLLIVLMHLV